VLKVLLNTNQPTSYQCRTLTSVTSLVKIGSMARH